MKQHIPEFIRFCFAGVIAFAVGVTSYLTLITYGVSDAVAYCIALMLGLHTAYFLNARYTFQGHRGIGLATWAAFISSNMLGTLINYLVFLSVMHWSPIAHPMLLRLVAMAAGTGVGLVFNYWANKRYAFRADKP